MKPGQSNPEPQELLIKGIFETSPEGILVVDDKNLIVACNHQFATIWHIPEASLPDCESGTAIGLDDATFFSPILARVKDPQVFLERLHYLCRTRHLSELAEIELLDDRTVEHRATALRCHDGQYWGQLWFFRDITEHKKFEDVRQRSMEQEKYHTILKTAIDGFWTVDKHGRFLEVNDAYCAMSGYSRDELLKMHIPDVENAEAPEETRRHIEKIIAEGSDRFETQHRRKDGKVLDVEVSTQYMPMVDQMFVVFVKDITERKRAEADIIAAKEDAERANSAKSQFMKSMSHELRTPLNAILGCGQLLEMNTDSSSPEQQEYVQHILSAGKHLLGLVDGLLDLTRIDSGDIKFDSQPLGIANIITDCVDQVTVSMAKQNNITIQNDITDTSLLVQGDDLRLRQVLIHLLSNAVKYNKENGHVTISSVNEKGRLRVEVHDNGDGIADEKQARLFTPFERLDQKHGTIAGAGIGLYVTKRMVEAMHGTIGIKSEPGQGSTFWFYIPIASLP